MNPRQIIHNNLLYCPDALLFRQPFLKNWVQKVVAMVTYYIVSLCCLQNFNLAQARYEFLEVDDVAYFSSNMINFVERWGFHLDIWEGKERKKIG